MMVARSDPLLIDLFRYQFAPARLLAARTRLLYEIGLGQFDRYLGRPGRISDLSDAAVGGWLAWLAASGRAADTVNHRRSKMLTLWRWCCRRGYLDRWPEVAAVRLPQRVPRAWTLDEARRLLAACEKMPDPDWWRAFHLVLWDTGERTGAMLALRWEWLDLATGELDVPGEVRKAGRAARYWLRPATLAALSAIQRDAGPIFPWPLHRSSFYNHYTRLLKLAGLPFTRQDKPQKMRRSFASHLEAAGGNATEALGHSARSVTVKSYLDPSIMGREPPNRSLPEL